MASADRRRIRIENAGDGLLWWRLPCALFLWVLFAAPIIALASGYLVVRNYARGLPAAPDLGRWYETVPTSSRILARDGTVLAELPFTNSAGAVGHRTLVRFRDIPPQLVYAILAAEDIRYATHNGVDERAIVRAAVANYREGKIVEGASTITQQLARNLVDDIGKERSLRRKVREALLAQRIEMRYDKRRILEAYANYVFLGANAYGVAAGARAYFSKELSELTLEECALIAGLIQSPGRDDPFVDSDRARARRNVVLDRMRRAEFISKSEYREAAARPLSLRPRKHAYGTLAPWFTEHVRTWLDKREPALLEKGGLVVETTALLASSAHAEHASAQWTRALAGARARPEVAAVLVDQHTGYVDLLVGGNRWSTSRFNRATQACRQPGSAFKPLVYAAALEREVITPATPLRDGPISEYDEDLQVLWKPSNSGRSFRGVAIAHDALALSLNTPAVEVFDRVGGDAVVDLARRTGITTELADVRPLALGASCVVPVELAGFYATVARLGARRPLIYVGRIRRRGEVIWEHRHFVDPHLHGRARLNRLVQSLPVDPPALAPEAAYQLGHMLRSVVLRGTATSARSMGIPVAGKTGTTNDNTDAWFVGYTGRSTLAVWIGHDDPSNKLEASQDGSHAALPLWLRIAQERERGRPSLPIPGALPKGMLHRRIDRDTGLLAPPGAGGAVELPFVAGTEPTQMATARFSGGSSLSEAAGQF